MAVAYRQNGGVESSGGGGGGSTVASSTQVSISQLLDSSGGSIQSGDSANNAIRVNVVAGAAAGSTLVTVRQSSAAELQVTATPAAGATFRTQPGSTLWASSAGFHFDSSGWLLIAGNLASSTDLSVTQLRNSSGGSISAGDSANQAIRVNVVAGAAGGSSAFTLTRVQDSSNNGLAVGDSANNAIRVNVVAGAAGGSTIVTVSTGSMWVHQSTASDLQVTATPVAGSTWRTQPGSTLWASSAGFHFDSSGALQVAASVTTSTVVTVARMVGNSSAVDYMPVRLVDSSGTGFVSPGVGFVDGSTASIFEAPGLAFRNSSNDTMRLVGSSTPLPVTVSGYVAPSTITTVSTGSIRVHQSTATDLLARVNQGVGNSSAADRWLVNTANSSAADYHAVRLVDSSGTGYHGPTKPLPVMMVDSSNNAVVVGDSANSALRVNVVAGAAGGSTVMTVSTGSVRVHQSTASDLNVTVAGYSTTVNVSSLAGAVITRSSKADMLVSVYQSTASDLNVTVAGYVAPSTTIQVSSLAGAVIVRSSKADALVTVYQSSYTELQATVRPPEWDSTYVSGSKNSSGDTTLLSSAASTRFNVFSYHFTIDSTTPTLVRLMNGSTVEMARWQFRAPSSIAVGANLAVPLPAYLYRTAVANPLILHTDSTATVHYSIAAFRST